MVSTLAALAPTIPSRRNYRGYTLVLFTRLYAQLVSRQLFRRQDGQTMAEYAVILSVISALVITALLLLGGNITNVINRIADVIK
jgi:Flp pilus assembly pilin Flp